MDIKLENDDILIIKFEKCPKIYQEDRIFLKNVRSVSKFISTRNDVEIRSYEEKCHKLFINYFKGYGESYQYSPEDLMKLNEDYEKIFDIIYNYKRRDIFFIFKCGHIFKNVSNIQEIFPLDSDNKIRVISIDGSCSHVETDSEEFDNFLKWLGNGSKN